MISVSVHMQLESIDIYYHKFNSWFTILSAGSKFKSFLNYLSFYTSIPYHKMTEMEMLYPSCVWSRVIIFDVTMTEIDCRPKQVEWLIN